MNVPKDTKPKGRGGVKYPFPERLFDLLEDIDTYKKPHLASILSWDPNHGRNFFTIHDRLAFQKSIQNKYFNQSKFASFRRQLNLWGFERVCDGKGKETSWSDQESSSSSHHLGGGSFYHPLFQRHDRSLCSTMKRGKLKKEEADTMQISSQNDKPGALFQSKRTNDFNLPNFPLLFSEQQQAISPQQIAQVNPRERSISSTQFYGDQENSLLLFQDFNMKFGQDDDVQKEKSSSNDDGEPLPFDSFQDKLQVNSAEEECVGNDQSFKELLDFLSDCDENIYKFLLGDQDQARRIGF